MGHCLVVVSHKGVGSVSCGGAGGDRGGGRRSGGLGTAHAERVLRLLILPSTTTLPAAATTASTTLAAVVAAAPVAPSATAAPVTMAALSLVAAGSVALDLVESVVGVGRSVASLVLEFVRLGL